MSNISFIFPEHMIKCLIFLCCPLSFSTFQDAEWKKWSIKIRDLKCNGCVITIHKDLYCSQKIRCGCTFICPMYFIMLIICSLILVRAIIFFRRIAFHINHGAWGFLEALLLVLASTGLFCSVVTIFQTTYLEKKQNFLTKEEAFKEVHSI